MTIASSTGHEARLYTIQSLGILNTHDNVSKEMDVRKAYMDMTMYGEKPFIIIPVLIVAESGPTDLTVSGDKRLSTIIDGACENDYRFERGPILTGRLDNESTGTYFINKRLNITKWCHKAKKYLKPVVGDNPNIYICFIIYKADDGDVVTWNQHTTLHYTESTRNIQHL
jgi:hypothetical protein